MKKSQPPAEVPDPMPKLDKVNAVRDAVEKLIAEVYAGKLHPRVAAGLAPLLNLQLRAVIATDLDQRLARVEKLVAKTEARAPKIAERVAGGVTSESPTPNSSEWAKL